MRNFQILRKFLLLLGFCLFFPSDWAAFAQDFGRGDRGSDGGRDRGSGSGGFGSAPSGSLGGGPPGGFGGGPPPIDQMFSRMDRNQDGKVTEDEVPSFIRERMQGLDLKRGATQEDLTRAFERMRQERESSGGSSFRGGPPGGFAPPPGFNPPSGGSDPRAYGSGALTPQSGGPSGVNEQQNSRSSSNSGGYFGLTKPRMTVDLPLSYANDDLDSDGQIGFYEWRKSRRNQTETFFTIDTDSDGFLTPTELVAAPAVLAAAARNSANAAPRTNAGLPPSGGAPPVMGTPSGAPVTNASTPVLPNGRRGFPGAPIPGGPSNSAPAIVAAPTTSSSSSSSSGSEDEQSVRRRAESMFRGLDRDRNGSISEEEWNRSRTLRPQFEGAGVDLTKPMSSDVFVETYSKLNKSP